MVTWRVYKPWQVQSGGGEIPLPYVLEKQKYNLTDEVLRRLKVYKDFNDLFDELAKYGLDIIDDEEIKLSFTPSYDSKLAKAIEDDRMNFVTTEKNYLLTKKRKHIF